jgi:hypothetical protein
MKLRPVNNWVMIEVKDLKFDEDANYESVKADLLEVPEYLEYEFKKGDKVLVDLTEAILIETGDKDNYIFAIDVDNIIGVYVKEETKPHIVN